MEKIPIITYCNGADELTSPAEFASHFPDGFKYADYVKSKNIKRCYIIFYDDPEKNKFFKKLKIVFKCHCGSVTTPVYEYKNVLIAIANLGGPAGAIMMEEIAVCGITEFIAIGSAGCLNKSIKDKFVLVDKAIRDEGTSYHYLKPSTFVSTNKDLTSEIAAALKKLNFNFVKGITWTTDAFYRETKQKVEYAKNLGAVAVEMECASWAAVAKLRGFKFAQVLYFSDLVKQDAWTRLVKHTKGYHNEMREIILQLVINLINKKSTDC